MNTAIIVAAGRGTRMNAGVHKQFIKLLDKPMLVYTLEAFQKSRYIDSIILVTAKEDIDFCKHEILDKNAFGKLDKIVTGGRERQHSVYNGLAAVEGDAGIVLIHDGARPLVEEAIIRRCVEGAEQYEAVTAGMPVKETIKLVDSEGFITQTPDRSKVWVTQTPQAFKLPVIKRAHEAAMGKGLAATDDAMLVELMGISVRMVEGSYENMKITTPEDLIAAETIIRLRKENGDFISKKEGLSTNM